MTPKTLKISLLAIVPALALGLSACGSSTTQAGAPPATSSMSATSSMPTVSESNSTPPTSESSTTTTAAAPASPTAAAPATAALSISNFMFAVPASVAPGAKITIKNTDTVVHTVTSETGGFDVKVNPNGTATLTAPSKPGSYPFVCTIHPSMTATLVVK